MLKYLPAALLVCTLSHTYGQQTAIPAAQTSDNEPAYQRIAQGGGWETDFYGLVGSAQYINKYDAGFGANVGATEGYHFGFFYLNAGIDLYYIRATMPKNHVFIAGVDNPGLNKVLVAFPFGTGLHIQTGPFIFSPGFDVPYVIDATGEHTGFALSPHVAFDFVSRTTGPRKHERAMGVTIKYMTTIDRQSYPETAPYYKPSFIGLGFHMVLF